MNITINNQEDLENLNYQVGDRLVVTYFVRDSAPMEDGDWGVTLEVTDIEGPD